MAREENSGTAREEMAPDKPAESALVIQWQLARERLHQLAREAGKAAVMAPDKPAEIALVIQRQLAWERPRPSSPPSPWLSSGMTREEATRQAPGGLQ